jgi:hypothetical protein
MSGKYVGWDQVLKQGHIALMKGVIDIGAHVGQTKRTCVVRCLPPVSLGFLSRLMITYYIDRQVHVWGNRTID